jgi:hypothetical protein
MIYQTLQTSWFRLHEDEIAKLAHPMAPEYVLRKVMLPEVALGLIAEDMNLDISHPLVRQNLTESRPYGLAMFPDK